MGDGASNEGAVHESMNFAAVYNLPIVFCLVNNHYAWSTPTRDILKLDIVADRAKAYGFPGYVCNGNDVLETYETVYNAVERARSGQGPSLVEVRAYRWSGHSGNDKNVYRTQDEIIRWQQDDCVTKFEGYLTAVGVLSKEEVNRSRTPSRKRLRMRFACRKRVRIRTRRNCSTPTACCIRRIRNNG